MMITARRHGSRLAILALSAALAWVMGVRTGRVKAFATGDFYGEGVAELSLRPSYDEELIDAVVSMTFTTYGSRFREGLVIESSFLLPETLREVTLRLDLDRSMSRRTWAPGNPEAEVDLTIEGLGARPDLVAGGSAGELELEAAFVREGRLGFRIAGVVTVVDPHDGRRVEVELLLETTPSAEQIAGDWAPPTPADPCEIEDCWADRGPEPGCTDTSPDHVYVEPSVGCSAWDDWDDDDVDDDDYDWGDDDYDWGDDDWGDDDWGDDGTDDNGNDSDDTDDNGN